MHQCSIWISEVHVADVNPDRTLVKNQEHNAVRSKQNDSISRKPDSGLCQYPTVKIVL